MAVYTEVDDAELRAFVETSMKELGIPHDRVRAVPSDTSSLGFNFMTMHYTLKAAMDGMLEHGLRNFAEQGVSYTCGKKDATGIMGMSATPLFDPQSYMELQGRFHCECLEALTERSGCHRSRR